MELTPMLKAQIDEVLKWVVAHPIKCSLRTTSSIIAAGERRSTSKGPDGFSIAETKDYDPTEDEVRDIDWVASAKEDGARTLLVTHYEEPRDIKCFVVIDASVTMDFGTQRTLKRMLAAELAGSVVLSASKTVDRVGTIVYSEKDLHYFQRPRGARSMLYPTIVSAIQSNSMESRLKGKPATTKRPGFSENLTGFQLAMNALKAYSPSPVFIISDFSKMTDGDKAVLKKMGSYHQISCLFVQDKRERELPEPTGFFWGLFGWGGFYHLFDMRTGDKKSIWLSKKNRRAYAADFETHRQATLKTFRGAQCAFEEFSTEEGLAAHPKLIKLLSNNRR